MTSFAAATIAAIAENIFDVTAVYFPITFTPPPNDPHGIRPEVLRELLRDVLTSGAAIAPFTLPLLLDKVRTFSLTHNVVHHLAPDCEWFLPDPFF